MNLRTKTWVFLILILSSVSGHLGADSPSSDDYYEEYEDESPQNGTNYKLNVPDSFKSYLEDLLTKANATTEKEDKKKVTSSKDVAERKDTSGRLQNRQGINYKLFPQSEHQLDVEKTLQSVANTLETSESLNSSRTKIFHPYASTNISQLLSNLGKVSSDSNLRNHRHNHKNSSSTKKIGHIYNNRFKSPEITTEELTNGSNDSINSKVFLRRERLSGQGHLAKTDLETQNVQFIPSTKVQNELNSPSIPYGRRPYVNKVRKNATDISFDKKNFLLAPSIGTKIQSNPNKPKTSTPFEHVLPIELPQTTNNHKMNRRKELGEKTGNETSLLNDTKASIGHPLQLSIQDKKTPVSVDISDSPKDISHSGIDDGNLKGKGFRGSLSNSPKVGRKYDFYADIHKRKNLENSVSTGSKTANISQQTFVPEVVNHRKQVGIIAGNDQRSHFNRKNEDSFYDSKQTRTLSIKPQMYPANIKNNQVYRNTDILETNNAKDKDYNLQHMFEDTNEDQQVTNKDSLSLKLWELPKSIKNDIIVNNRDSKIIDKTPTHASPKSRVDEYAMVERNSPLELGIYQGDRDDIHKNIIKNASIVNHSTKTKRRKSLTPKNQDKILSRGIINIHPANTLSKHIIKSNFSQSAQSQNMFPSFSSKIFNSTNKVTPISLTKRLEPVENPSKSTHTLPSPKNITTQKEHKVDSSSAIPNPRNMTKTHPIEDLIGGLVKPSANKKIIRKRKRKLTQINANKMKFSHVLKELLDKENRQEATNDQFDSSDRNETLSFKNSPETRVFPRNPFFNNEKSFEEKSLETHNSTNTNTGKNNNVPFQRGTKDAKVLQDNRQLDQNTYSDEGSTTRNPHPNIRSKEGQSNRNSENITQYVSETKGNETTSKMDLSTTQFNSSSQLGFNDKHLVKGYSFNRTSSLSDEQARDETEKHPIEELLESLVTIPPVRNSLKRKKKKRISEKKILQDEPLDSEPLYPSATGILSINATNNSPLIQSKLMNRTQNDEVQTSTPNTFTGTKHQRQKGTYSESKFHFQRDNTNLTDIKDNSTFKFNNKELRKIIMLPDTLPVPNNSKLNSSTDDEQLIRKPSSAESKLYLEEGRVNSASVKSNNMTNDVNTMQLRNPIHVEFPSFTSKPNELHSAMTDKQINKEMTHFNLKQNKTNLTSFGGSNTLHVGTNKNHQGSIIDVPVTNVKSKPTDLNTSRVFPVQPTRLNMSSLEPKHILKKDNINFETTNGTSSFHGFNTKDHVFPIRSPFTSFPFKHTYLNTSRTDNILNTEHNMSSPEKRLDLQNNKANLETNETNNSILEVNIKEQRDPISLLVGDVPSRPYGLNTSRVNNEQTIKHNMTSYESDYYLKKRKLNLESQENNNSFYVVNVKDQRKPIQSSVTSVTSKPPNVNHSIVHFLQPKQHNMPSFESKNSLQKGKANLETTESNVSNVVQISNQRNPFQLPFTSLLIKPTNLNTSKVNYVRPEQHNVSSFSSINNLQIGKATMAPIEGNISNIGNISSQQNPVQLPAKIIPLNATDVSSVKAKGVLPKKLNSSSSEKKHYLQNDSKNFQYPEGSFNINATMHRNPILLVVPTLTPSANETTVGKPNPIMTVDRIEHKNNTNFTEYNNNDTYVPQKRNTPNNSTIFVNPSSSTMPVTQMVEHQNVTFNGTNDLVSLKQSNEKYSYIERGGRNNSNYSDPKKSESRSPAISENKLLNNLKDINIESSFSSGEKVEIKDHKSEAHVPTTSNKNQWLNLAQKYWSKDQATQAKLVRRQFEKQTYHGQQSALASEDISPWPFNSSRSMIEPKGAVQSPFTSSKTDTNTDQQNMQVPNGNVLEVLLYKIYNVLKLYLQKTSEQNGTVNLTKHQQSHTYIASNNQVHKALLGQEQLKKVTKHSFLSKEKQIIQNNHRFENDIKPSDVNLDESFSTPDLLHKQGKPKIIYPGTSSSESPNVNMKVNTSSSVTTAWFSTTQSPKVTVVDTKEHTSFIVRDTSGNKARVQPQHTDNSETNPSNGSTTPRYNETAGKGMENGSTMIQANPDFNGTVPELNIARPTKNSSDSINYEALNDNKNNEKATKLKQSLKIENVKKLVNKLYYVLNSFDYNRRFKAADNEASHASGQVNHKNLQTSSKNKLLGIVSKEDINGNVDSHKNESSNNKYIAKPIKETTKRQISQYNVSSVNTNRPNGIPILNQTQKFNLGNGSGESASEDSNQVIKNSNEVAKTTHLDKNGEEGNPTIKNPNSNFQQKEMYKKPTTKLFGKKTNPMLVVENGSYYETENKTKIAQIPHPANVTGVLVVNNEVNKRNPKTVIQNNNKYDPQSSIVKKEIPIDFSSNNKITQDLYDSGRLHIVITPLDKKPNISVEISQENKNSSTRKSPWIFHTNKCGEGKAKATSSNDSTGSSVRAKPVEPSKIQNLSLPLGSQGTNKQGNIKSQHNEEVNKPSTEKTREVLEHGTAKGKLKRENGDSKDFSLDVNDTNKVKNRKRVTKKEEVVEVNEKMKENKILGKSKTVQTIKTEVSSVDYE